MCCLQYVDWSSTVPVRALDRRITDIPGDPSPDRVRGGGGTDGNTSDYAFLLQEKSRHAHFWTDPSCRAMYRAHARKITHRRNVFSGCVGDLVELSTI